MASKIEQAMQAQRDDAIDAAKKRDARAKDIIVSIGHGRYIVDYKDKDGVPQRFEYLPEEDEVAIAEAEATTQRREVVHG